MIEHTYRVLEFYKLLNILCEYASCPLGRSHCLSLKPLDDLRLVDDEQNLVSEMKLLVYTKGFLSFEGLTDIGPLLEKCRAEGSRLEPESLLSILDITEAINQVRKLTSAHQTLCPRLHDLTIDTPLFEGLREAIKTSISPHGVISDTASPQLKKMRRRKILLRRELQKKLENIKRSKGLTTDGDDALISIRDGRYVIPLRADMKSRVNGIVHDYSHTQATCFFEPSEVIQDNNRLTELSHLEKEEELRILATLTSVVRDHAEDLCAVKALLGALDGLYARAQLSHAMNCIRPVMSAEDGVDLRQARNPILLSVASSGMTPVPVDIHLDRDQNVMIISGPNRGGKTVTLKTLGLLSLMAQAGVHIPASEGSSLPVFKNIMAEIGDDQDILAGLSTFSAHLQHLKHMIEHADKRSLVIIDEPGMGTDPDEGAALAMAALDDLSRKGALIAVSTHNNRLKTYGLLNGKAKNASMEFDRNTNRPTFVLRYGTPGTSCAFEIARDSGIGPEILDRAQGYLDRDEIRLNRLIDKLNHLRLEVSLQESKAKRNKEKYHAVREKLLQALMKLETDKKALLEKKRGEAEELIRRARTEFRELFNRFEKKAEPSQAGVQQGYNRISKELMERLSEEGGAAKAVDMKDLRVGQWVLHKRLQQEGTIKSLDPTHSKVWIMTGNVKLCVDPEDLDVISERKGPGRIGPSDETPFYSSGGLVREINLIGFGVEDALSLVDKEIDRAIVQGQDSLKIVHGHGTGKLRSAVRKYLSGLSDVKRIYSADLRSGGEAVTLVELD